MGKRQRRRARESIGVPAQAQLARGAYEYVDAFGERVIGSHRHRDALAGQGFRLRRRVG